MRQPALAAVVALVALAVAWPAAARHHCSGPYWGGGWGWGWGGWWGPTWAGTVWVDTMHAPSGPPNLGVVDTDVSPERALVYLDGDLIGTADDFDGFPDYLYLEPGRYRLEFRLGGFVAKTIDLEAEAGAYYPVDSKLERAAGQAVTPWWDEPEGLPKGRVFGPKTAAGRPPAPSAPDPMLRPETARPGQDEEPRKARGGAALEFRITPDNASVYLDGELMGTAEELSHLERGLAVSPGSHHLDVLAPGHMARSFDVVVEDAQRRQVVVELQEGTGQAPREGLE